MFPRIKSEPPTTTNPTKINLITPVLPEETRSIIDLTFFALGSVLNLLIIIALLLNSSLHSSKGCYLFSLILSNLVILVDPLRQVLRWFNSVNIKMNLDYVFLVTFNASILTLVAFNINVYILICLRDSPMFKPNSSLTTGVKSVLVIWTTCVAFSAMELHLYDHYEREVVLHIYVSSTFMFLFLPTMLFVILDSSILYELRIVKTIDGNLARLRKEVGTFILLVALTISTILTTVPYRLARAIVIVEPSACCADSKMEFFYLLVKMTTIIVPIVCLVACREIRGMFQVPEDRQEGDSARGS